MNTRPNSASPSQPRLSLRGAGALLALGATLTAFACGPTVSEPEAEGSPTGCEVAGRTYDIGESFPAPDGCNSCSCQEDGSTMCTAMACIVTCDWGEEIYEAGDSFPAGDGCNTCECMNDGTVGCTLMACPECWHGGKPYQPGDTFPADDECNSCECMPDGTVACTEEPCFSAS